MTTYQCAVCKQTFEKTTPDDVANAEAERLWGVPDASTRDDMAIVCDDCFQKVTDDLKSNPERYW